jgi:uncharacterized protein (TIGR04255 family)
VQRDMTTNESRPEAAAMPGGHTISKRFYLAPDCEFPILQIGPGIFAANQSSDYEWNSFKKLVIDGVRAVLSSYPSQPAHFPLTPTHLELRYVDAFDRSLVGTTDIVQFLKVGTRMRIELPEFLRDASAFAGDLTGRVLLQRRLKKRKESQFNFDLGSGSRKGEKILRLETKVVTMDSGVPKLRKQATFLNELGNWLEFAHDVTSPCFKSLVTDDLMKKFERTV